MLDVLLVVLLLELLHLDRLQREILVLEPTRLFAPIAQHDLAKGVPAQRLNLQKFLVKGITITFILMHSLRRLRSALRPFRGAYCCRFFMRVGAVLSVEPVQRVAITGELCLCCKLNFAISCFCHLALLVHFSYTFLNENFVIAK